jgi:hypothetical protein
MLKRECYHILDSLKRNRLGVSWKTFADDDLDPSNVVARVPMVLEEKLVVEVGEPEPAELAILRKRYKGVSAGHQESEDRRQTYPRLS